MTNHENRIREVLEAGHDWSSLAEAEHMLATMQSQPAAAGVSDAEAKYVEQIMEQAQVFASAWSLVGGRFDFGNALDDANEAKDELRALVARAILALRPQAVPMTDEVKEQALDLLATMFDAYENGVPCHEDDGGYIGMAFSLDNETFHACAGILNAHRPKSHHGITAPAGGEGKA